MKFLINSILSSLVVFCSEAQNIQLLSSSNKNVPVAFASISYYNDTLLLGGAYADENGVASLRFPKNCRKVKIASIGFRDTIIKIANLQDTIFLLEELSLLNEVVVLSDNSQVPIAQLGFKKARRQTSTIGSPIKGSQVVTRIDNPFQVDKKIQAIEFWMDKKKSVNRGFLKVVFFEIDGLKPGKQIDIEIILSNDELEKRMIINIDDKDFSIPKEGFFVGIEWMSCIQNEKSKDDLECVNRITGNFKDNEIILNQVFVRDKFEQNNWTDLNEFAPFGSYLLAFSVYVYE